MPTWSGLLQEGSYRYAPVRWERMMPSSEWDHEVAWLPRRDGKSVAVHRFAMRRAEALQGCHALASLALEDAHAGHSSDQASNMGGFHSERDLFYRPEVVETELPSLIASAVRQTAQVEAAMLQRAPITTTADEAWWNVLGPGHWNALHTHAGSTYSGVLYLADGGASSSDSLAVGQNGSSPVHSDRQNLHCGRLALVSDAPSSLTHDQDAHVLASVVPMDIGVPCSLAESASGGTFTSLQQQSLQQPGLLLLDPAPGTCIVFPSFIPHLVFPTASMADPGLAVPVTNAPKARLRASVAFNFGACDPVLAHVLFAPSGRIKLVLETIGTWGL